MRIAILGNSGSGKSTLARLLAAPADLPVLDLDTIAWEPGQIAVARDPAEALADLRAFCAAHPSWIVEGCYERLVEGVLDLQPLLVFADPGLDCCLAHCQARPWEPHKYPSRAEQDQRLPGLLEWVRGYYAREDGMSWQAHRQLFDAYTGPRLHVTEPVPADFRLADA